MLKIQNFIDGILSTTTIYISILFAKEEKKERYRTNDESQRTIGLSGRQKHSIQSHSTKTSCSIMKAMQYAYLMTSTILRRKQ